MLGGGKGCGVHHEVVEEDGEDGGEVGDWITAGYLVRLVRGMKGIYRFDVISIVQAEDL